MISILRFKCTHTIEDHHSNEVEVHLETVYYNSPENRLFFGDSAPSGRITLNISNPEKKEFFKPGHEYQIHVIEAIL